MASIITGLGGAQGVGENSFIANGADYGSLDDGSVQVDVTSVFGSDGMSFFGTDYTDVYINTNGTITFDGPETITTAGGVGDITYPAVMPFATDIDISSGSATGANNIYWDLDPAAGVFTVTWLEVEPFASSGVNTFQVQFTENGAGGVDIDFRYETIEFTDGSGWGGSGFGFTSSVFGSATAGFTDGGGNVTELPGSGDATALADYPGTDFGSGTDGLYSTSLSASGAPVCFTDGVLILTPTGERPVEALRAGDLVTTLDNGPQPIRWIARNRITATALKHNDRLRPIRIAAGALGPGVPARDLVVSQQHRVLCAGPILERMMGAGQALSPAKFLLDLPGVETLLTPGVRYHHLVLDRHEILKSDGAWTESIFLGPQAVKSLPRAAQEEVRRIFPGLIAAPEAAPFPPARALMSRRKGEEMTRRAVKNGKPLWTGAKEYGPPAPAGRASSGP